MWSQISDVTLEKMIYFINMVAGVLAVVIDPLQLCMATNEDAPPLPGIAMREQFTEAK